MKRKTRLILCHESASLPTRETDQNAVFVIDHNRRPWNEVHLVRVVGDRWLGRFPAKAHKVKHGDLDIGRLGRNGPSSTYEKGRTNPNGTLPKIARRYINDQRRPACAFRVFFASFRLHGAMLPLVVFNGE
jgi:hypothetical protein